MPVRSTIAVRQATTTGMKLHGLSATHLQELRANRANLLALLQRF
jgi:hypothetical protein